MYNRIPGLDTKHKHVCPECNTVWEHPDACMFLGTEDDHTCPECGCIEHAHPGGTFSKYFGDAPVDFQFVSFGHYEKVAA